MIETGRRYAIEGQEAERAANRPRRGTRHSRFPRCWELTTGEEVTGAVWYVNRGRKPYPRVVLVERDSLRVVAVRLTPPPGWKDPQFR